MKKLLSVVLFVAATFVVVLNYSCKKKDDNTTTPSTTNKAVLDGQVQQHNSDANYYKGESDQADDDINSYVSNSSSIGARTSPGTGYPLSSPLCGVLVDSSQIAQKILLFNFDGVTPCFSPSRTRGGQIKVQLTTGNKWADVGAVLTMTYINFKVTRLYDNKSITFNGVKTLKNVNGNDWINFYLNGFKLKYQERALNVAVTFDGGLNATWNVARVTEWTFRPANSVPGIAYDHIDFSATGDTAVNGLSKVDTWGINRYGTAFTAYYTAPLVSNTYCGLWRFNSGQLVLNVNSVNYTLTLGTDQNGNPTPYVCAYGFKVTWPGPSGTTNYWVFSY